MNNKENKLKISGGTERNFFSILIINDDDVKFIKITSKKNNKK